MQDVWRPFVLVGFRIGVSIEGVSNGKKQTKKLTLGINDIFYS